MFFLESFSQESARMLRKKSRKKKEERRKKEDLNLPGKSRKNEGKIGKKELNWGDDSLTLHQEHRRRTRERWSASHSRK